MGDRGRQARIQRALTQRIYVIGREVVNDRHIRFKVVGTTDTYTVDVCKTPSCSCPDAVHNQNVCKHMILTLHRVFKLNVQSELLARRHWTLDELESVLKGHCAVHRKALEGECSICYEEMTGTEELTWCKQQCGNNFHTNCFNMWITACRDDTVTCPYCRSVWS